MSACRSTRRRLLASRGSDPGRRGARHLRSCLACQADAVRIRALHRRLTAAAGTQMRAPLGFPERVMTRLDAVPERSRARVAEWVAAAAALVVAVAVTLAGRRHAKGGAA